MYPFAVTHPHIEHVRGAGDWISNHPERANTDEERDGKWKPIWKC
jgi:hypothetical protein